MDVCDAQPKHCRSDHRAQTGPRPRLNKTFLIDMQFISQHSFFHSDTKGFSMKEARIHNNKSSCREKWERGFRVDIY